MDLCFNQAAQAEPPALAPIELPTPAPLPSLYPTDVTHVGINREQELLRPGFSYYLFQKLPSNLWFNLTTELSQRYESNVFFTKHDHRGDYIYRTMPNISLGYEGWKGINIYTNYFVIKDIFAQYPRLTFPTTQSLSLGLRRDFTINQRTTFQVDFQSRELWQSTRLRQFDFLPGITLTRFVGTHGVLFSNIILQMRGGQPFVAPTREIDPFYTLGFVYTKGQWLFSNVGTLVTNFRHPPFNDAVPPVSNNSIIYDFEISHPVPKMPYLVSFVRAEPIWNWHSHNFPGISGFDFRLFGGLRLTLAKPAYHTSIESLKQQLKEFNLGPAGSPPGGPMQNPSGPEEQPSVPTNIPEQQPPPPTNVPEQIPNEIPETDHRQSKPAVPPKALPETEPPLYTPSGAPVGFLFNVPATIAYSRETTNNDAVWNWTDIETATIPALDPESLYTPPGAPVGFLFNVPAAIAYSRKITNNDAIWSWIDLEVATTPTPEPELLYTPPGAPIGLLFNVPAAIAYSRKTTNIYDVDRGWTDLQIATINHPSL